MFALLTPAALGALMYGFRQFAAPDAKQEVRQVELVDGELARLDGGQSRFGSKRPAGRSEQQERSEEQE
jgi:hypothetical protein